MEAAAKKLPIPVRVLGGGTNVLIHESGVDGLVIGTGDVNRVEVGDGGVTAEAGASLSTVIIESVGAGLGGLEALVGIPGTIAGAVVCNATADGREIASLVKWVEVIGDDGIKRISRDAIDFGYRTSSLGGQSVVRIHFELPRGDAAELTKRLQQRWIARNNATPPEIARGVMPLSESGSMSLDDLMKSAGMAGSREGGVTFHPTRPEYLIAGDDADARHVLTLIERAKEQVLGRTGTDLRTTLRVW